MSLWNNSEVGNSTQMDDLTASKYDGRTVWICCQAALSFMTVILIYICLCLVWFVKSNQNTRTLAVEKSCNERTPENKRKNRGVLHMSMATRRMRLRSVMRYTCLFASAVTLLKFLVDQVKFFQAWNAGSDFVCEIVYDVTDVAIFYLSYMGIYSFLWLKQWLFYCDPVAAKFLYSRRLVIFSRVFVVFVFIISLGVAAVNWIQKRYKASSPSNDNVEGFGVDFSSVGCISVYDMTDPDVQWPLLTYTTLNAIFQITLLSLFIYPLLWDKLSRGKVLERKGTSTSVGVGVSSTKNKPISKEKHLQREDSKRDTIIIGRRHVNDSGRLLSERATRSIRRTIFWTAICIFTDASLVAAFALISIGTPQVLVAVATDFDLLVNIICILATYSSWKKILFPMFSANSIRRESSTYLSSYDTT